MWRMRLVGASRTVDRWSQQDVTRLGSNGPSARLFWPVSGMPTGSSARKVLTGGSHPPRILSCFLGDVHGWPASRTDYFPAGSRCVYMRRMAPRHFLFVVFSDSGHLNPVISMAQYLESNGHEVTFFGLSGGRVAPRRASGTARALHDASGVAAVAAPKPEAQRSVKLGQRVGNKSWLKWWTNAVLVQQVPAQVAALRSVVRERRPDVIVADPLAYAAPVVAGLEGIPWPQLRTGLQSIISDGEDGTTSSVYREIAPARERMLAALGVALEFRNSDAWSPWLNTVFAMEGLLSNGKRPEALVVGPAVSPAGRGDERPFPFDKLPADRPIVYIDSAASFRTRHRSTRCSLPR